MWKIIKSEYLYNKYLTATIMLLMLTLITFITIFKWESAEEDFTGISSLLVGSAIALLTFRNIRYAKEKTERFITLLPVKKWKINMGQLLFIDSFYLIILAYFLIIAVLFRSADLSLFFLWFTINISGIALLINAAPLSMRNLMGIIQTKGSKVIITLIYIVFFILVYLVFIATRGISEYVNLAIFQDLSLHIHSFGYSPGGALFIFAIAVFYSLATIWLYSKRKVYFE